MNEPADTQTDERKSLRERIAELEKWRDDAMVQLSRYHERQRQIARIADSFDIHYTPDEIVDEKLKAIYRLATLQPSAYVANVAGDAADILTHHFGEQHAEETRDEEGDAQVCGCSTAGPCQRHDYRNPSSGVSSGGTGHPATANKPSDEALEQAFKEWAAEKNIWPGREYLAWAMAQHAAEDFYAKGRADERAKIAALLQNGEAVHVNILRGNIVLSRRNALHIAEATDHDIINHELFERDQQIIRLHADLFAARERIEQLKTRLRKANSHIRRKWPERE